MIDLIMLGTGATMPTPERGVSAAALRCAGRYILFDCGEGTQVALRREHVSPVKIDLIALTHYHGDHIFGLPGLLQTMSCLKRTEPLTIAGPEGLEDALRPILQMVGELDYEIHLDRFDSPWGTNMRQLNTSWPQGAFIEAVPTEHRVPSQGYAFKLKRRPKFRPDEAKRLEIPVALWKQIMEDDPVMPVRVNGKVLTENGRIVRGIHLMGKERKGIHVVFTGDTMPCESILQVSNHADILIHDATYGENNQADEALLWGHSTFEQAAALAKSANVDQLWLTHFSQSMRNPADYLGNATEVFANTVCSYDGLTTHLEYSNE